MKRRMFLAGATGVGTIGGCLRMVGGNTTPITTSSPTQGEPDLELLSLTRSSSQMASWDVIEFEIKVDNSGYGSGIFEGTIQQQTEDGWMDRTSFEAIVPADSIKTISQSIIAGAPGETVYRIKGYDVRSSVSVIRPELQFGEKFRHPNGQFTVSVDRFDTRESVQYQTDTDTTETLSFEDTEEKLGFVWLSYGSQIEGIAPPLNVQIWSANSVEYNWDEYPNFVEANRFIGDFEDTYLLDVGSTTGDGELNSGWLPFIIPDDFELQRVGVTFASTDPPGAANWMP